ncbi:hypothetical protein Dsin_024491 [Dipteronia sinensis]|uniref:Reverse transcriptase domain-containing protein n=1 Tax=Dipteronia sinensis TaxID=43782 RepID=A0AAD9ZUA7_9ROSI|nr:hypothetical protein Dsin_024491 [Dipteronia sinensis]
MRNAIDGLFDDGGVWREGNQKIESVVTNYFSGLFSVVKLPARDVDEVFCSLQPCLSQQSCDYLDLPFIAKDIRRAVFDMAPTKSPGPDGLPALFYQKYWETVGPSITEASLKCLNDGESMRTLNETLICLIRKRLVVERMVDFRPISLCKCRMTVRFSFLINGTVCGSVEPLRGLRQGDLVSPYLYLLVLEGLSGLIREAVDQNVYIGFRCGRTGPVISHLFFTNDSLLFSGATTEECLEIRRILNVYSRASGQLVNFDKSEMCVSLTIFSSEGDRLAAIVGVRRVKCHERYLGLPYW